MYTITNTIVFAILIPKGNSGFQFLSKNTLTTAAKNNAQNWKFSKFCTTLGSVKFKTKGITKIVINMTTDVTNLNLYQKTRGVFALGWVLVFIV